MTNTSYAAINTLEEISLIGGSYTVLEFTLYEENGVTPLNISAYTITWEMTYWGYNETILTKNGTITGTNVFEIELLSGDTLALSGKFMQQPVLVDGNGNTFRPAQGTVIIAPAIQ